MNNTNQLNTINLTSKDTGDVWVRWFYVANYGDPMRIRSDRLVSWVKDCWGHYGDDWRKRATLEFMFDDHRVTINAGEFFDAGEGVFEKAVETIRRSE